MVRHDAAKPEQSQFGGFSLQTCSQEKPKVERTGKERSTEHFPVSSKLLVDGLDCESKVLRTNDFV